METNYNGSFLLLISKKQATEDSRLKAQGPQVITLLATQNASILKIEFLRLIHFEATHCFSNNRSIG